MSAWDLDTARLGVTAVFAAGLAYGAIVAAVTQGWVRVAALAVVAAALAFTATVWRG